MVPGTPSRRLSYLSPAQINKSITPIPFRSRKDYLFLGYLNPANVDLLEWFYENVFQSINKNHKFHIVGMVTSGATAFCKCQPQKLNDCIPLQSNVVCHGPISDDKLEILIRNSLLSINTSLEPSGIATKTCRSLTFGTPTVVSELDGTFDGLENVNSGAKICNHTDTECVIDSINSLLTNEDEWNKYAVLGPKFVSTHYGPEQYKQDWLEIFDILFEKKLEILIYGDTYYDGEYTSVYNWHIANTLNTIPEFHVTVVGKLEPNIDGVTRVDIPSNKPQRLPPNKLGGLFLGDSTYESPFQTGFQANVIIQQAWPSEDVVPLKYCGVGCRFIQILSWNFDSIPQSWASILPKHADALWIPSIDSRSLYESFWSDSEHISIVSHGVDCKSFTNSSSPIVKEGDPITFIFIGEMFPQKGIDIILDEWDKLFCGEKDSQLKLFTSFEFGYSQGEIKEMENIMNKCSNVKWVRNSVLSRDDYVSHLISADILIAPFISEGYDFQIIEALAMGLSVITTLRSTTIEEFLMSNSQKDQNNDFNTPQIYYVLFEVGTCEHYPCVGDTLCIFPPCTQSYQGKESRCRCEKLIESPSWYEINKDDLRKQIFQAFTDKSNQKMILISDHMEQTTARNQTQCWSKLQTQYKDEIVSAIKKRSTRLVQEYKIFPPVYRKKMQVRKERMRKLFVVLAILCFIFFSRRLFPKIISFMRRRMYMRRGKHIKKK